MTKGLILRTAGVLCSAGILAAFSSLAWAGPSTVAPPLTAGLNQTLTVAAQEEPESEMNKERHHRRNHGERHHHRGHHEHHRMK